MKEWFKNPKNKQLSIARLMKWHKVNGHPKLGKEVSKETIEKRRIKQLEYYKTHNTPNKGIKHKPQTRINISLAIKRHWQDRKKKRNSK